MKQYIILLSFLFSSCILLSQNTDFQGIKYIDVVKLKDKSIFQGKIISIDENHVLMENIGGYKQSFNRKEIKNIQQICHNCDSSSDKNTNETSKKSEILSQAKSFYHHLSVGMITSSKLSPGGSVTWTSGYFLRPRIGFGLGTGVQSFGDYADINSFQNKQIVMTPIFGELKAFMKENRRTPYISIAGGYSFPHFNEFAKGGFYFFPSIGTQFSSNKGTNFTLNFGLLNQRIAYDFGASNYDYQIIYRDIHLRRWTLQAGMLF